MTAKYKNAIVKFNNGRGACLCNGCHVVLLYGFDHTDVKRYCAECYKKQGRVSDGRHN